MRRAIITSGMAILAVGSALAQMGGIGPSSAVGASYGAAPGYTNTFPYRLSKNISGQLVGSGKWAPSQPGRQIRPALRAPRRPRNGPPVVGAIPIFGYGPWGWGWAPAGPQRTHITVQNIQPPQPPVIVNQYYQAPEARPVVKDYGEGDLPEPQGMRAYHAPVPSHPDPTRAAETADALPEESTIYLIAFEDQTIFAATEYRVEGDTLHFTTTQGSENRAPVEKVDQEFSERLNRERNVAFQLSFE